MYENHHINPTQTLFITIKEYYENKYFCIKYIFCIKKGFFILFNQTNKHKAKIYNQYTYTQVIIKKQFYFFSLQSIRMSRNSINLDDKKIKKVTSTITKTKKYSS